MSTNKNNKKLSQSMEDYLEAIAVLKRDKGIARVKDISRLMDVKTPSVTAALNTLSDNGLVKHERYGYAELTPEGEKIARGVYKKHKVLIKFLTEILDINVKTAAEDACKIEHSISPQTFEKLTKFIEFVENSPSKERPEWLRGLDYYFKTGKRYRCRVRQKENRDG